MRSSVVTRSLVSAAAVVGIAAGSLAGASASFAVSAPASQPVVRSEASVLATVNLGLSDRQATNVQCWLKNGGWGYTGALDGELGTNSWKAFQRYLQAHRGYTGAIDGIVGGGTVSALQRLLRDDGWGYTGPIDGVAGSGTQAAFKRFADGQASFC